MICDNDHARSTRGKGIDFISLVCEPRCLRLDITKLQKNGIARPPTGAIIHRGHLERCGLEERQFTIGKRTPRFVGVHKLGNEHVKHSK